MMYSGNSISEENDGKGNVEQLVYSKWSWSEGQARSKNRLKLYSSQRKEGEH